MLNFLILKKAFKNHFHNQYLGISPHFKAGGIRLYLTGRGCKSPFSSML